LRQKSYKAINYSISLIWGLSLITYNIIHFIINAVVILFQIYPIKIASNGKQSFIYLLLSYSQCLTISNFHAHINCVCGFSHFFWHQSKRGRREGKNHTKFFLWLIYFSASTMMTPCIVLYDRVNQPIINEKCWLCSLALN